MTDRSGMRQAAPAAWPVDRARKVLYPRGEKYEILQAMAQVDWEKAAKRDYVAKHGSVPFWVGLSDDAGRAEAREVELRARLQGMLELVRGYAELSPFERQRRYPSVYRRLCQLFDEERKSVTSRDKRFLRAIDEYESGTLALLDGFRPRP